MQTSRKGRWGEELAVWWLRLKGYRIVMRHFRGPRYSGAGEVDIIARRGDVLAFVEVKVRASIDEALYAIHPRQQRRILHSSRVFLAYAPRYAHLTIRFDAILISPRQWPRHLENAWCQDQLMGC